VAGCEQGTEPSSRIKQRYKNRGPPPWRRNFVPWRLIFASNLHGTGLVAFPAHRISTILENLKNPAIKDGKFFD